MAADHKLNDETGATSVEYGILVAGVLIGVVALGPFLWQAMIQMMDFVITDMLN